MNQFTPEGVAPLLETYFNIKQTDIEGGLKWIAIYYTANCPQSPTISYETAAVTYYDVSMSIYIQNAGSIYIYLYFQKHTTILQKLQELQPL